jgi:hypothetical protein
MQLFDEQLFQGWFWDAHAGTSRVWTGMQDGVAESRLGENLRDL